MRRRYLIPHLVILGSLAFAGCGGAYRPTGPLELSTEAAGLSGLATDADGGLWAIPEERRQLLRIDRDTGRVRAVNIEGVPEGLEAEALTFLGDRLIVGTEADGPSRPSDALLVLEMQGETARVVDQVDLPYSLWGLEANHNRGLEGLCSVGDDLFVTAEVVGTEAGRRFAPLAHRGADGQWRAYRLWLSSETGKVSGITCRAEGDGIEFVAIERHFAVTRLIGFTFPGAGDSTDIQPRVLLDLDDWVRSLSEQPNFEGIAHTDDDEVALLVDNQYGGQQTGPSALWFVKIPR